MPNVVIGEIKKAPKDYVPGVPSSVERKKDSGAVVGEITQPKTTATATLPFGTTVKDGQAYRAVGDVPKQAVKSEYGYVQGSELQKYNQQLAEQMREIALAERGATYTMEGQTLTQQQVINRLAEEQKKTAEAITQETIQKNIRSKIPKFLQPTKEDTERLGTHFEGLSSKATDRLEVAGMIESFGEKATERIQNPYVKDIEQSLIFGTAALPFKLRASGEVLYKDIGAIVPMAKFAATGIGESLITQPDVFLTTTLTGALVGSQIKVGKVRTLEVGYRMKVYNNVPKITESQLKEMKSMRESELQKVKSTLIKTKQFEPSVDYSKIQKEPQTAWQKEMKVRMQEAELIPKELTKTQFEKATNSDIVKPKLSEKKTYEKSISPTSLLEDNPFIKLDEAAQKQEGMFDNTLIKSFEGKGRKKYIETQSGLLEVAPTPEGTTPQLLPNDIYFTRTARLTFDTRTSMKGFGASAGLRGMTKLNIPDLRQKIGTITNQISGVKQSQMQRQMYRKKEIVELKSDNLFKMDTRQVQIPKTIQVTKSELIISPMQITKHISRTKTKTELQQRETFRLPTLRIKSSKQNIFGSSLSRKFKAFGVKFFRKGRGWEISRQRPFSKKPEAERFGARASLKTRSITGFGIKETEVGANYLRKNLPQFTGKVRQRFRETGTDTYFETPRQKKGSNKGADPFGVGDMQGRRLFR